MSLLVSICCATYNHEKYIRDALEGFIMQKTDFAFEVLIHDDASTDKTADIIREYEAKYPDIIKPIYQTKNQYSKGVKVSFIFNFPRAKGKYIALCEGDDYWIADYAVLDFCSQLGSNSYIKVMAYIGPNTSIGNHCFIAAKSMIGGAVSIGEQCFIGLCATLLDEVKISDMCIIGACSIVKRNMRSCSIYKTSTDNCILKEYSKEEILEKLVASKNVR